MHNNVLKKKSRGSGKSRKSGKASRGKIAKNKDAFSSVLLFIIIALVIFVVLFVFILSTTSKSDYEIRKERCKSSVKTQAFVETKFPDVSKKLDCPTEYITIKGSNQDVMKRQLADQMYDCWDKMGQNKIQLWGDTEGEKFCIICSVVDFKDKKNTMEDFTNYLATHKPAYNSKTYFELFNGQPPKIILDAAPIGVEDDLETSRSYAVIYTFLTGDQINKMEGAQIGAASGVAVGLVVIGVSTLGVGLIVGGVAVAAGLIVGYFLGDNPPWTTFIGVVPYQPEVLDAFNCVEIPTNVAVRG